MSKTYVGYVPRPAAAQNAEEFRDVMLNLGMPLYDTVEESKAMDAALGIPLEDSFVARVTIEIIGAD